MTYKTIDEWIEHNPNHIGAIPIEVCHQIWGTKGKGISMTQPEQEPLAWMNNKDFEPIRVRIMQEAYELADRNDSEGYNAIKVMCGDVQRMLPPQRTWVGLTKEEIAEFDTWHDNREEEVGWCNPSEIVAYIEAKLRSKNNV